MFLSFLSLKQAVAVNVSFWSLMDELMSVEASTRHDYQAYMALGADEPRPNKNKKEYPKRQAKRDKLKALVERREDNLLVEYLKCVSHLKGYL